MGFIKFTKGTSLSDKDRKALQKLLSDEKKKLQSALKDVDASLSMLGGKKAKKKKKEDFVGRDAVRNLQVHFQILAARLSSWGLAQACACKPASNRQEFAWVDR